VAQKRYFHTEVVRGGDERILKGRVGHNSVVSCEKTVLVMSLPYVCPEPGLVNWSFDLKRGRGGAESGFLPVSAWCICRMLQPQPSSVASASCARRTAQPFLSFPPLCCPEPVLANHRLARQGTFTKRKRLSIAFCFLLLLTWTIPKGAFGSVVSGTTDQASRQLVICWRRRHA
jgi:hypothetical protein